MTGGWQGSRWRIAGAIALAAVIFWIDTATEVPGAVSVLYAGTILLVADVLSPRGVAAAGATAAALAIAGYLIPHAEHPIDASLLRLAAGLVAIAITTVLALRTWSAQSVLVKHAELLDLAHETVVIRDISGRIRYWNSGAERLYGYSRAEALGADCRKLLKTALSIPEAEVMATLRAEGRWAGELVRTRRDGAQILLESHWSLREDRPTRALEIVEISTDITEKRRAGAAAARAEQRYGHIFEAAGVAIWAMDWSGVYAALQRLGLRTGGAVDERARAEPALVGELGAQTATTDVNSAGLALLGTTDKADLLGPKLLRLFTPRSEASFIRAVAALVDGAPTVDQETEFQTLDGRRIEVILRATVSSEAAPWDRVLVSAVDVTARNRAQRRLDETLAELAHATRVMTLGELTASIAHEVNQPLAAIITFGQSGKRWLAREATEAPETAACLDNIVSNGRRALEVVKRIRAQTTKAEAEIERLALPELADASLALVRRELATAGVSAALDADRHLAAALGDRVQIQQVIVNLLLNAIQAMERTQPDRRQLAVEVHAAQDGMLGVFVSDNGPGIPEGDPQAIFAPFFTTKANGMGIGLSICRSIIEAHGGRISAANRDGGGARVGFVLPPAGGDGAASGDAKP
ncbi:PAS domain-containing sensor histidine kinase [Chelatococcus reniformis]|uniref:histidine kinase n=1 Tax=Chelatococcus reniformis TaxID=1494448 RepID=A0A916XN55_9HYPH|nr:ATP-binding protein [Chelatococcus reniformis]GGC88813.1 PAS domain-containing sensor histidine kinase [Chelatococcus reniformis]